MANLLSGLKDKTLVMVIGPAAIGKSAVMRRVCEQDPQCAYVTSFTTRPNRNDGKSTYQHLSVSDVGKLTQNNAVVTAFTHPTTGYIYGTYLDSFSADVNLLDTLSGSVEVYRKLPFKRTVAVSITTDPDAWETWFYQRYPEPSAERTKRLQEAIMSVEWSLSQTANHDWLINNPDNLSETTDQLIQSFKRKAQNGTVPKQATELLSRAKLLLSYE